MDLRFWEGGSLRSSGRNGPLRSNCYWRISSQIHFIIRTSWSCKIASCLIEEIWNALGLEGTGLGRHNITTLHLQFYIIKKVNKKAGFSFKISYITFHSRYFIILSYSFIIMSFWSEVFIIIISFYISCDLPLGLIVSSRKSS